MSRAPLRDTSGHCQHRTLPLTLSSPVNIAMPPTVTAIIPTYNRARFVAEAVQSVLAQTKPVDEIIVVDDGSTDNTGEVLKPFVGSIRYLRQTNAGPGAARNHSIAEARSDFVAFLDSDDLWMPEKNRIQTDFLSQHTKVDFLFGDMAIVSSETDELKPEIKHQHLHDYFVAHATHLENLFECIVVENMIPTSSVMARRSCFEHTGVFDPALRLSEDLDLWLRFAVQYHCAFVNAVVEKRRRHDDNLINNWARCCEYHAEVLERARKIPRGQTARASRLIRNRLSLLYYDLGSHYLKQKDIAKSRANFSKGTPRHALDWKWAAKRIVASLRS